MSKIKKIFATKKRVLFIILAILIVVVNGTAAWLTWRSKETSLVLTIGDINNVQVTLKPYQIDTTILPVNSYENEAYTNVTITNSSDSSKKVNLFYRINHIDQELISTDFKYTITKSTDNGTTYTEYITGDFSTALNNNYLYIMDEIVEDNSNIKYKVYIWLDGSAGEQTGIQGKSFKGELRASISSFTGADMLVSKSNPSTLMYNDATPTQKGEMWTFSHEETDQVPATTDYRYIGSTPNNYITFNDETWRIIGVFDGNIKIVKDEPIYPMSIDYKQSGVGSSTSDMGSNDWSDSQLMYMLNPTTYTLKSGYTLNGDYIMDSNGNIIYQLGCEPASIEVVAPSYYCNQNYWNLNEPDLFQVATATYYLGEDSLVGYGNDDSFNYYIERGTIVSNDRPFSWTGQVGLMYLSDYQYTFANGVDDACYNSDCNGCVRSSSWLYKANGWRWLLAPYSDYDDNYFVAIEEFGNTSYHSAMEILPIYPVVYLKSDIKLQGTGTSSTPYTIVE